jgi:hypothetical protein
MSGVGNSSAIRPSFPDDACGCHTSSFQGLPAQGTVDVTFSLGTCARTCPLCSRHYTLASGVRRHMKGHDGVTVEGGTLGNGAQT